MKRKVTDIVVHCSATQPSQDIGRAEIDRWHRQKGWRQIGYHYVIRRDGRIEVGRGLEEVGAHVEGHNAHSVGICLVGGINGKGVSENNFTDEQFKSLGYLLRQVKGITGAENILGHRDYPNVRKACPSFDVREWLKSNPLPP